MISRTLVVALLAVSLLATLGPARAEAKTIAYIHQVTALVPARVWQNIGFVPMTGMDRLRPPRIRWGKDVYYGAWQNALVGRRSTSEALKEVIRQLRLGYSVSQGVYADRALTSREKRQWQVMVDLARDADVLVVKQGHPACSGLTLGDARAIASGRATTWSSLDLAPAGAADRIELRHTVRAGMYEPRFGALKKPTAAKGRADGGVAEAAGNASVAAVTSWARARYAPGSVCRVPLDGVAPSDVSVHGLSYKGAYPVMFVAPKKRKRNPLSSGQLKLYVKFLKSAAAAKLFRQNGLLMKADTPQPPATGNPGPGAGGGPSQDWQGRPITATRDDAAAQAALQGERLERPGAESGSLRLAFEPDSVLNVVETYPTDPPCAMSSGRWTLIEGWRYPEHGGGLIARVRFDFESSQESTIEFPNETPGFAVYDGQQWTRSRSLAGSC